MRLFRKKEKQYHKLFGQHGLVLAGIQSLWLAKDHVLLLTTYFSIKEDYRRFYLKDIQWVLLRKSFHGKAANILACTLTCFSALFLLVNQTGLRIFGVVFVSFFLLVLLVNLLLGPTCQCEMGTAVQEVKLRCLSRLRRARKFMRIISPLIEQAQGTLSPEMFAQAGPAQQTHPNRAVAAVPSELRSADTKAPFHKALFALLILAGMLHLVTFFWQGIVMGFTEWGVFALEIFSLIGALVRQFTRDIPKSVGRVVLIVIIFFVVFWVVGYFYGVIESFAQSQENLTRTQWEIYKEAWSRSPDRSPFIFFLTLLEGVLGLGLGFTGLGLLRKYGAFNR